MKNLLVCALLMYLSMPSAFSQAKFSQAYQPPLTETKPGQAAAFDGVVDTFAQWEVIRTRREVFNIKFPENEPDSSTFKYLQTASNFIKNGDTVNAHNYLFKTDPYHIHSQMELNSTPLDSFVSFYKLSGDNKARFIKRQLDVKSLSYGGIYDSLKRFYFKSLQTRRELDSVSGKDKPAYERFLIKTDSIQLALLRSYIARKGWPSLADGSLFAAQIALYDREYYYFYIPYLQKAFQSNQISLYSIKKILVNDDYYYNNFRLQKSLRNPHKVYDVTDYKDNFTHKFLASASLTQEIQADMKAMGCKIVDYFFVYYANNVTTAASKFGNARRGDTDCSKIWKIIDEACPVYQTRTEGSQGAHFYLPNYVYKNDKEFFYVIYKK